MNIKADLLGFTYTDVFEFYEGGTYPGSIDAAGNPSSMDLSNVLNSGAGVINYIQVMVAIILGNNRF